MQYKNTLLPLTLAFALFFTACKEECSTCNIVEFNGTPVTTNQYCTSDEDALDIFEFGQLKLAASQGDTVICTRK